MAKQVTNDDGQINDARKGYVPGRSGGGDDRPGRMSVGPKQGVGCQKGGSMYRWQSGEETERPIPGPK